MQDGDIVAIADSAEQVDLLRRGIGEKFQRLVAMAGENHFVEGLGVTIGEMQGHRFTLAGDRMDRCRQPQIAGEEVGQRLDMVAASACHSAPGGLVHHLQQAVIAEKLEEGAGRITPHRGDG